MNNSADRNSIIIGAVASRILNDAFRQSFIGGQIMMTAGIVALGRERQLAILEAVKAFNQFDEGNDPYGEHDFGAFEQGGDKLFFKIDYYDPDLQHGSEDPANASVTRRVLTIMLAEEW